jgi:hypothetical protein
MGDISRHRDIYLNTRAVLPAALLARCKLSQADLTYLELGNYLTDVSQFRDPVTYIFAKQRIWRDMILPKTADKAMPLRVLGALAGAASLAASQLLKDRVSGVGGDIIKVAGPVLAGAGGILALIPSDTLADIGGADEWIDAMFGTPIEQMGGDPHKRDERHYGLIGEFFRYFIEGITHLLFSQDVPNQVKGPWGQIGRIGAQSLTSMYQEFYTQYYPHEHTDQPPYTWDASQRPKNEHWYGPSTRQRSLNDPQIGVMNAVDTHYVQYLAEELSDLEQQWRSLKPSDTDGRRQMLVRMGKILHGVEDWYFHSNVVEIFRMRSHTPPQAAGENDEDFLKRFVNETATHHPEFRNATATERLRLRRRVYRRLRYPVYERGTKTQSGGIISKSKPSTISLRFAYPAFPSQQDTAHTLLHALENLEHKVGKPGGGSSNEIPPWAPCVLQKLIAAQGGSGQALLEEKAQARGVSKTTMLAALAAPGGPASDTAKAVVIDVLREWLPLVVTLLNEHERQRLVANIEPLKWPLDGSGVISQPGQSPGDQELQKQLERHKVALQRRETEPGIHENNYEHALRYLVDCGFMNQAGQKALIKAFEIDARAQKLLDGAPGCGGFLMQFAIELQTALDVGDAALNELNQQDSKVFDPASDNGAFSEIVGSHSLMSKDTLESPPFFNEAKVMASLASSSVMQIMLEQISAPTAGRRLPWKAILHHFIRYPVAQGGWERRAIAFFQQNKTIPTYADLPELAKLVESALRSREAQQPFQPGTKNKELREEYIRLETVLSRYRYP